MKLTYKNIIYLFFFVVITACGTKKKTGDDLPPVRSEKPIIYEKADSVALSPSTIKEFINWASGSDLNEREIIRKEIMKSSKDEEVLKLLFEEFENVDVQDVSYSLIVLSIIGEMQNPNALPFLEKIIYRELPKQEEQFHSGLTKRDLVEMLSSKAVECVAYLKIDESNRSTLNVISQHPSIAVRSAAIDAYLFNNDDSEEAKKTLKEVVRESEANLIDRTRFTRNSKKEEFDRNLSLFYKNNPKEIAPEPGEPTEEFKKGKDTVLVQPVNPPKRNQK